MSVNVIFKGNCEWEPAGEIVYSTDALGLDVANWEWRGRVDKLKTFEDSLEKFSQLTGPAAMYFMGASNDGGKVFPTVTLRYLGIKTTPPEVKVTDTKTTQTVSSHATPTSGKYKGKELRVEASYRASRTIYNWIETQRPAENPRYSTVRIKADPFKEITDWRIIGESGNVLTAVDFAAFGSIINSLRLREDVSDYQVEDVVPGRIWACSSSVDYVISGT